MNKELLSLLEGARRSKAIQLLGDDLKGFSSSPKRARKVVCKVEENDLDFEDDDERSGSKAHGGLGNLSSDSEDCSSSERTRKRRKPSQGPRGKMAHSEIEIKTEPGLEAFPSTPQSASRRDGEMNSSPPKSSPYSSSRMSRELTELINGVRRATASLILGEAMETGTGERSLRAVDRVKVEEDGEEDEERSAEEESEDEDYTAAAGEIMAAIESKDAGALATALKAFVSAC
jgi:hypothetical protein